MSYIKLVCNITTSFLGRLSWKILQGLQKKLVKGVNVLKEISKYNFIILCQFSFQTY